MYSKLKADMNLAGIKTSEGGGLEISDLQPARDFLYHKGVNIGEDFQLYEAMFPVEAPVETPTETTAVAALEETLTQANTVEVVPTEEPTVETTAETVETPESTADAAKE